MKNVGYELTIEVINTWRFTILFFNDKFKTFQVKGCEAVTCGNYIIYTFINTFNFTNFITQIFYTHFYVFDLLKAEKM